LKNELFLKTSSQHKKRDLSKSKKKQTTSQKSQDSSNMNVTNLMNTFLNESSKPIEITNSAQYSILE
jgi:hypothetical protein